MSKFDPVLALFWFNSRLRCFLSKRKCQFIFDHYSVYLIKTKVAFLEGRLFSASQNFLNTF